MTMNAQFNSRITKIMLTTIFLLLFTVLFYYAFSLPIIKDNWALATTVKPESFTELYFDEYKKLPKTIKKGQNYSFSYTIHNLENKDMQYPYEIKVEADGKTEVIEKKSVLIKNGEFKTFMESFIFNDSVKKVKVNVTLVNKNQSIAFWMKE